MKLSLLLVFGAFLLAGSFSNADVIDPIGNDPGYKNVRFQVEFEGKAVYPNYQSWSDLGTVSCRFDDVGNRRNLSSLTWKKDSPGTITLCDLRQYVTKDGDFVFKFFTDDSYAKSLILHEGALADGSLELKIKFKRIDINHMLVTRHDGTTYYAEGSVQINAVNKAGDMGFNVASKRMTTRMGVWVPVGYIYHIKVDALTGDDFDSYEATVDFTDED